MSQGSQHEPDGEGISLERLSRAYAQAMGTDRARKRGKDPQAATAAGGVDLTDPELQLPDGLESHGVATDEGEAPVSPQGILEALLFVGQPDNRPLTAESAAGTMRGVSAAEIPDLIAELNARYAEEGNAFEIVEDAAGYSMRLRAEFARLRDAFHGRAREVTLSQAAVDVLALVAYKQPVTLEEINQLRGIASGGTLRQLVRRRLVRFEADEDNARIKRYFTTRRMLNLMGLESLDDLPRSDDA